MKQEDTTRRVEVILLRDLKSVVVVGVEVEGEGFVGSLCLKAISLVFLQTGL